MFDLAADFRNVAERNPRIGQLPVSSVPILPHVLDGLMEAPWATARYVPVEGGTPGTPESEVASAGTYELQAIGCASGTRLLN